MATNGWDYASNITTAGGTGAVIGAMVGGPWGAVIGGGVGALGGLFNTLATSDSEDEKRKAIEKVQKQYNLSLDQIDRLIQDYYSGDYSLGTQEDADEYRKLVSEYNPEDYIYQVQEFDKDYDVNDYYNPNKDAILQNVVDKTMANMAASRVGHGKSSSMKTAEGLIDKNEELYKDALTQMNQERQFDYNVWNNLVQQQQKSLETAKSAADSKLNLYGDLAKDWYDTEEEKLQAMIDSNMNRANGKTQFGMALASI